MGKAIKNYRSKVPAAQSIDEIQRELVKHGAVGVLYEYEGGRIAALKFLLPMQGKKIAFSLPVGWRKFQQVLKNQKVPRADDEDYVYRVAWRCIRDWVLAQMALYETQVVDLPQIFLPFAMNGDKTVYDRIVEGKFLLGNGD